MKDGTMLSNYDVEDGHTVHLVAKPPRAAIAPTVSSASSTEQEDAIPPRMRYGDANGNSPDVNAIERGRTRLRNLMNSIDALERNVEARSMTPPGIREPDVRRPVMSSRRRIPGLDSSTETLSNIDRLRSALEARRNIAEINDRTARMQSRFLREADRMAEDQRRDRRWPFGDQPEQSAAAMASDMGLSSNETMTPINLDHIMQGMMTMRTVLSTAAVPPAQSDIEQSDDHEDEELGDVVSETMPLREPESPGGRRVVRGRRRFFVGQWLDVRDTVNQWLESTVIDMSEDKVLVHYHGWPSRWDEWIDFDSERIAAFRTRTTHTLNVQHMSPVPTTRLSNPPSAGSTNVRHMVTEVRDMMHAILPHIERFAELCEQDEDQGMASAEEELDARARHEADLSEMAHLVSPLFDRFGRILADSARCLDPLMRPELQQNSQQRRQLRASINRGSGYQTPEQRLAAASSSMRSNLIDEDTAVAVRDLVTTAAPVPPENNRPRRSIDVHIHAIVSPSSLSSLASLARATTMDQSENHPHRLQTPRTPPVGSVFDDPFGLPSLRRPQGGNDDERAILNDIDDGRDDHEADQSRTPLLGSYRRQGNTRRRRQVESNLDAFLADDFFGPSYSASEDDDDSDNSSDEASPANSRGSASTQYQPPSAINSVNAVPTLGVIPEIAQAEARARANENQRLRGESSSSSSSGSSSTSSTGYPTFLEVMRRTLSGVRNFGFSSNRQADENGREFETPNVATPNLPSPSSSAESFLTDQGLNDEAPSTHSTPSSSTSNHILEDLDDLD